MSSLCAIGALASGEKLSKLNEALCAITGANAAVED